MKHIMELTRVPGRGSPLVQAYGDNGFRIAGQRLEGTVFIYSDGAQAIPPAAVEDIDPADLERLVAALPDMPEILLIGAGEGPQALPAGIRGALARTGIAIEVMGTGAACRTYNVLVAEGRQVAAILLPVP